MAPLEMSLFTCPGGLFPIMDYAQRGYFFQDEGNKRVGITQLEYTRGKGKLWFGAGI